MQDNLNNVECECEDTFAFISKSVSYMGDGMWAELIVCERCGKMVTREHKTEIQPGYMED